MNSRLAALGIDVIPLPTPFLVPAINVYVIKTDPPTLVDVGPLMDEAYDELVTGLAGMGYTLRDIGSILITHDHLDHTGQLQRVLDESGAEAYAHPQAVKQLAEYDERARTGLDRFADMMREMGARGDDLQIALDDFRMDREFGQAAHVHHSIDQGDTALGFEVHCVPGHSATDLLLVDKKSSFAFTGDHLLRNINPVPLLRTPYPGEPRGESLVEMRASLEYTATLNIDYCAPGHAECFSDANRTVEGVLRRQAKKAERVLAAMGHECVTPVQLSKRLHPKLAPEHLYLGVSVAASNCELLVEQGRVEEEDRDGVIHYARVHEPAIARETHA